MKKAKIVASVVLAAALSTTMFAAACGKKEEEQEPLTGVGKEFSLADYAHPLDSAYAEKYRKDYSKIYERQIHSAFTAPVKKDYAEVDLLQGNLVKVRIDTEVADTANDGQTTTDRKYAIYDVKENKEVSGKYEEIAASPVYADDYYYRSFNYYILKNTKADGDGYEFQYAGPDGKLLTSKKFTSLFAGGNNHLTWSRLSNFNYTDEEGNSVCFLKLRYQDGVDAEEEPVYVEKFFSYTVDTYDEFVWKEVTEDELGEPERTSDYPAGTQFIKRKALTDSKLYPDSKLKDIEYTIEGSHSTAFTFYRNNTKTSTVTIENGEPLGFVGSYLYYYEIEDVDPEATEGYNWEEVYGDVTMKSNYTLFRYNFVNGGEAEEVESDYIFSNQYNNENILNASLYSYSSNTLDWLMVTAEKKTNGVVSHKGENEKRYTLIVDENLDISQDISAKTIPTEDIYKLNANRFLCEKTIYDSELNVVAVLPASATVWAEKSLIRVGNFSASSNGHNRTYCNTFVDYDGKVVIEPALDSETPVFYGDVAYYGGKLYSKANPSGVTPAKLLNVNEKADEYVVVKNGLLVKYVPSEHEITLPESAGSLAGQTMEITTYKVTVHDLAGTVLLTINDVIESSSPVINFVSAGGKYWVTASFVTSFDEQKTESGCWLFG